MSFFIKRNIKNKSDKIILKIEMWQIYYNRLKWKMRQNKKYLEIYLLFVIFIYNKGKIKMGNWDINIKKYVHQIRR